MKVKQRKSVILFFLKIPLFEYSLYLRALGETVLLRASSQHERMAKSQEEEGTNSPATQIQRIIRMMCCDVLKIKLSL